LNAIAAVRGGIGGIFFGVVSRKLSVFGDLYLVFVASSWVKNS
jgi:hypothetical protein